MEVKDQATATEAALNLDKPGSESTPKAGEPTTPRSNSTASKLFPEFVGEDGKIYNQPVRPFEDKSKPLPPVAATPAGAPAPASPTPVAPTPQPSSYLDLSKLPDGTMVRMKVDGTEMDVPAKDVLKSIQLERHLTLQSQKLAAERAAFEAERAAAVNRRTSDPSITPPPPATSAPKISEDPRVAKLEAEIAAMRPILAKQRYEAGLSELESKVKAELGADDFRAYVPKIQEFIDSELAKPEVQANPIYQQALDQKSFWYQKYLELKIKGGAANPVAPKVDNTVPVVVPMEIPAGTIPVVDRNNNPVPIPVIESSGGAPSRESPESNWQARYQAAYDTATKTGSTEDWMKVFRLKREVVS